MMPTITLKTPPDFHFWSTAMSHGWCELLPYSCDEKSRYLERLLALADGTVVRLMMHDSTFKIVALKIEVEGVEKLTPQQSAEVRAALSRCLEIDRDLSAMYAMLSQHSRYAWVEQIGAGRMLASPTVWEDLVKTLFTTNTVWGATKNMCKRLVELGDLYPRGGYAFPTPQRIAAMNPDDLNAHVRAGYRSGYLHLLATRIASGEVEVESWCDPDMPSDELYKRIRGLKGFGDYAAGNLLRLLGHFDRLATDTVCREVYKNQINNGVPASSDKEIAAYYEQFGKWRGLAQWMDVMYTYFASPLFKGEH
jgi:3-methyladenine DNA glycosylase/8-oxoguanine DNA glycosylase